MPGHSYNGGVTATKEKFTGKERDVETGFDYFGARYYASGIGRFLTTDRFAHKYPNLTPYQYAANNPIRFIDVNGDSLNVSQLQRQNPDLLNTLISELTLVTGVLYEVSQTGFLVEQTCSGDCIKPVSINGRGGSSTARDYIKKVIDSETIINVGERSPAQYKKGVGSATLNNNDIALNELQLIGFKLGTTGVNPLTLSHGMTFIHELQHTTILGGLTHSEVTKSQPLQVDETLQRMNKIRGELGEDFGQRMSYIPINGAIPFGKGKSISMPNITSESSLKIYFALRGWKY